MKQFIIISCLFISLAGYSQVQTDTLQWNASGFTDLITNEAVAAPCHFVSYGTSKVDWIQGGGSFTTPFSITSVTGMWQDINSNGTLTFSIIGDGLSGQLILSKDNAGTKVKLVLSGGTGIINNLYTISSVETL